MDNSESYAEQASGLRGLYQAEPVRAIAVASGKGGVGKTSVSVNLGIALAQRGRDVMLLDADLGLGNVDVALGLQPRANLSHVIDGSCELEDVLVEGPAGVRVVPSASGIRRMLSLGATEHAGLIHAFGALRRVPNLLLIDTGAGINDSVLSFSAAAQEVVVVVCDEPASLTDAYALIKVLHRECGRDRFRVLASMARSEAEARDLYLKMLRVTDRFLDVSLDYMGAVPYDDYVRRAVRRQRAVVDAFPRSRAALAFKKLASVTDKWPQPDRATGRLEFFIERLVQAGQGPLEMHA